MNRISDTIIQVLDVYTGENITYNKTTVNEQGAAITDSDCDGVIYRKLGTEYFKRNINEIIYPRWFGAIGNSIADDSVVINSILSKYTRYTVDGEGLEYFISDTISLKEKNNLKNFVFRMNDSTKTAIKWGIMESEGTVVYKRALTLDNIRIKGVFNYGLVISGCTGFNIENISFEQSTAYSAFMYLNRMYDGVINYLNFSGVTSPSGNRLNCKCLHIDIGVNGVILSEIYTSAIIGYGVYISQSGHVTLINPVLQGHAYGLWVEGTGRVSVINPYFEETVNHIVTNNASSSVRSVNVSNGLFLNHSAGNTFAAVDNGGMITCKGDSTSIDVIGAKFSNTTKAIAVVDGSATIILRACHGQGSTYNDIRQGCFRASTAGITAGYYIEQIGGLSGSSNGVVTTSRTAASGNQHITTYTDSGGNLNKTIWTPPIVGNSQTADVLYVERVGVVRTSSYTILNSDDVVRFNTASGNLNATLPTTGALAPGKKFLIKKVAGANNVNVITSGGVATIDGAASYQITGVGDTVLVQWDGTNYIIYSKSPTVLVPNLDQVTSVGGVTANSVTVGNFVGQGSLSLNQTLISGSTTLTDSQTTIWVNNVGAATITLPTAVGRGGRVYIIKKLSASLNNVIIQGNGAELIDASNTFTMATQYSSVQIQSNGTSWYIIGVFIGGSVL